MRKRLFSRAAMTLALMMAFFAPLAMNGQTTNQLLSQNFDGTSLALYDNTYNASGWYTYNAGSGNNWELYQSTSYALSGNYCMTYGYTTNYGANCYLVSEPFNVSADMTELSVSLYEMVASSSYPETFEVFFIKASDVTTLTAVASADHYGAIASASYTNSDYTQVSGSNTNSALAGQSVRVVIHCTSTADMYRLYIDDITVTETIAVACPSPTGLTASNVTTNSAILNWNGNAESYIVRYRKVADVSFSEDFENDLSNWTIVDADEDGFKWESHINTGTGNHTAHSGDGVAYSESYDNKGSKALNPDNWLITPQIQLGGSVSFWAIGQDENYPEEHFAIYVSTTGTNPTDFTQISEEYIATDEYVNYNASLSDYSGMGYVAIRHFNVSDQFILNIDDVEIYVPNDWVTVNNVNGNSLTINSLTADTDYEFQVQANYGTDGESGWSTIATFHTLDYCGVPYELSATNITAGSATLNWTGAQAAYNVRYRELGYGDEVTATEDFTDYEPLCYNGGTPTVGANLPSDWIFQSDNSNYPPRVCNNDGCSWVPSNMANQGKYLYMTDVESPLDITGLNPSTTYEWQVQGVDCDGNGGTTEWSEHANFTTFGGLELADNDLEKPDGENNAGLISGDDGTEKDVIIAGRTLFKNGYWNTLCLPFGMTAEQVTAQLAPTALMELDASNSDYEHATGFDNGTLYLNFKAANAISAGVPYIIKWSSGDKIVEPVFTGVTIPDYTNADAIVSALNNAAVSSADETVTFKGIFSALEIDGEDKTMLYLSKDENNEETKLFYPNGAMTIGAFRAYFQLNGIEAGDVSEARLYFGGDATGVKDVQRLTMNVQRDGGWFTLDGLKLKGKPTKKGLYIHGGRKAVVK